MRKKIVIKFVLTIGCIFLFCTNNVVIAQGPTSPEAASFEPVDATDMVSLMTGDLSYVLPLLNVPSPEGGYPIALSYHAGIALDQEASWVGLGWNLNPGAINRGVNGYPDDWGKTSISEFFYDEGWTEDYYGFSIGYAFSGATSVGLGLSWGSNKSLSGSVSLGLGAVSLDIGANGVNAGVSSGNITGTSFNISTRGVGLGYGISNRGSNGILGINLNYNYGDGLAGNFSVSKITNRGISSVGVSLSSNSVSLNARSNGSGAGISNSSSNTTAGDYNINVSSRGFSLPLYSFNINYSHTKVKYSLFKNRETFTSGMLYPMLANETYDYTNGEKSIIMNENNFMDVDVHREFDETNQSSSDLIDYYGEVYYSSIVLPSYDKFAVNSQGLSGDMSIYNHTELNLSGRGGKTPVPWAQESNWETNYLNHDITDFDVSSNIGGVNLESTNKKYFTFNNAYNSFLRFDTSNFVDVSGTSNYTIDKDILKEYVTNETTTYNNSNSLTVEKIKREGNVIQTFTNKEIRDNTINNFFEAREGNGFLNRQDNTVFLDEGIGAFKITTTDGKVYHYSLPVYQYETYYKSFKDDTDEDKNFFTNEKTTPYATHWLLTGITGPDYYDKNSNGIIDDEDYGYWVTFDYGKWSDGYIWQNPSDQDFEEIIDVRDSDKKTFSYAWGRKQVYYLDAIKTRTHTALFVKETRLDNQSKLKEDYVQKAPYNSSTGRFDILSGQHSKHHVASSHSRVLLGPWNMFDSYNNPVNLAYGIYSTKRTRSYYNEIPKNSTLALKKILLLKNEVMPNISKENSTQQPVKVGVICDARLGYTELFNSIGQQVSPNNMYFTELNQHTFEIDIERNVLDTKDISGLNLESLASQVIDLEHDYTLAKGAPTSSGGNGKLTLKNVNFKGKSGVSVIPPYKFNYHHPEIAFNKDDKDDWGYHKTQPKVWSLSEIITPTGGKIQMDYESDSFYAESATYEEVEFDYGGGSTGGISLNSVDNTEYFKVGNYYKVTSTNSAGTPHDDTLVRVTAVSSNSISVTPSINFISQRNVKIYGHHYDYTETLDDLDGKKSGGIRVKSIKIKNENNIVNTTSYQYDNPLTGKTTGITSYSPTKIERNIPYVSMLPGPMVMYSNVKVINKGGDDGITGSTSYEFETLKPRLQEPGYIFSLGDAFKIEKIQDQGFQFKGSDKETGNVYFGSTGIYNGGKMRKYKIHNNLGILGRVKAINTYNSKGHILTRNKNNYKSDLIGDNEIGVTQETHKSVKKVFGTQNLFLISTSKINYPSVLQSTSTTQGNFNTMQYFDKHDFLTGQVLETRTVRSDGLEYKTALVPAYTKYSLMGSKIDNSDNKNMLAQKVASYSYLINPNTGIEKLIGTSITTWNNQWSYRDVAGTQTSPTNNEEKIWRKHRSYYWKGDRDTNGAYIGFNESNDDGFNWGIGANQSNSSKWKLASETTRYDHYSMSIESKDLNENYTTVKTADNNSKVIAVANAKYTEVFYSGAEYDEGIGNLYLEPEIRGASLRTTNKAHTGKYSIKAGVGDQFGTFMRQGEHSAGKYRLSVWVHKDNYQNARVRIVGSNIEQLNGEKSFAGDWVLLSHYFDITTNASFPYLTSNSGDVYYDDLRIHPIEASMSSYVYNEFDEVSYIMDGSNLATHYVYDNVGRLIEIWAEALDNPSAGITGGFKKVQKHTYNYKNQ